MPSVRLAACALLACGAAAAHPGILHEEPPLPCGWQELSRHTPPEDTVTVRFSLRQQGVDALREAAERVSDPRSPSYGQYFTRSQIDALTAPSPDDAAAVEGWLRREGVEFTRPAPEVVEANIPAALAEKLLQTRFRSVVAPGTGQRALRAEDFALPPEVDVAVAAVYGVHGLPLPPREVFDPPGEPVEPANVTPAVVNSRYNVKGVKPAGSPKNRQAVAEFQGQLINQKDLDKFFSDYLPGAPSTMSKIYKYVGQKGSGASGVESALDVDYIMGVAPGVLTEYWYWGGMDFCADLKNWTGTILAADEPPLVHSVSYGWQGDLAQIGCKAANVQDVDVDFMKLAARGITIVFASGDSGSGYSRSCGEDAQAPDTAVVGDPHLNQTAPTPDICCRMSDALHYKAWSWVPPTEDSMQAPSCSPHHGMAYEGKALASYMVPASTAEQFCCQVASGVGDVHGFTVRVQHKATAGNCTLYTEVSGFKPDASSTSSVVVPPKMGRCLLYSEVGGKTSKKGVVSGGDAVLPVATPKLWPSWPASSPWVTSVGATRFVQQDVSQPEMATDQFGSGGGFSDMFPAFAAQATAAKQYLASGVPHLPPAGSFPPGGRATPDVSALGEGYQVIINGQVNSIGGTSASAPAFAALVSLLNEARLGANKPPMGYMNPWLYAHPEAFTDVTIGTNAIGRGTGPLPFGFPCAKGWDPATGLGTPIFDKMMAAALAVVEEPTQQIVV